MDDPSSPGGDSTARIVARSSMIDSFRGCGLSGIRIVKEDLRRRITMPKYIRHAMRDSIKRKDPAATATVDCGSNEEPPEAPMVVFVNSRSGGRYGPVLTERLQELMGEEQVFDLSDVKPNEFVEYGLRCLENLASLGNFCAKEIREKIRIVVAGGDGTVGWVLGSLSVLYKEQREPVPPVGIVPLGTGNDLARSFGWGGSFPFAWKSAVKRSLHRASTGLICRLDSWHVVVSMPLGEIVNPPYSLKPTEECTLDQSLPIEGELPEKEHCYEGVFYNYFSIGMDAQVAYGFHHLRNEKPYLAQGPIANKLIYSGYSCTQGWFLTPCISDPSLRGLKNILRMHVKKVNCSDWEQIPVPKSVRAIVALNLHNYGSGRNPWGNLKPGYLEKKGFVEAHADDGLLEIFGLKQGWHASLVMVELISAKHIAQAAAIRLEFRGGEWKDAFMQMDGEPWKQPLNKDFSTFVEIKRVPFQSYMISGE
ncbi:DAGK_acc domain-containing protein/DAGK_cat domain-containing protein [Cephalotus follicularis]|uniref:Diacylglycerol kinase n=1 Tax=Cephalotus follicularis TaxID=3775 RepID=A0A1Q3CVH6_CEPFO|nr:DAGK_acc domain-containing protein/DAGK_cat domain-containing protein [Cephalotus follicularis]